MREVVQLLSWIALVAAAVLAALHLQPRWQLLGERMILAASLIPYGLPLAAAAVALFAITRSRTLVIAVACTVLLAHFVIARPYWPGRAVAAPSDPITVMTMNMRCNPPGDDELARILRDSGPEVAVLNGLSERSRDELTQALADRYPTAAFTPMPGYPACGTVVFTDLPFDGWVATQRHPTAVLRAPGFEFTLVAVDLPTPTAGLSHWLKAFDDLIEDAPTQFGRPVVAVGDFNAVVEHEPMRRLAAVTGVRDAVVGFGLGWLPTFPDDSAIPPVVALDHVLISPGLVASSAWTESVPGQAHRALFVELGVAE
jgi:endonuclease/exonuclease/phosphatase (EEP) superfamily protein YafD